MSTEAARPTRPVEHDAVALYDAHGAVMFAFAVLLLDDQSLAQSMTLEAIGEAARTPHAVPPGRAELVSQVYRRCCQQLEARGSWSAAGDSQKVRRHSVVAGLDVRQRSALGLCRYGRPDYRWVAHVMVIAPATAAELLRAALRCLPSATPGGVTFDGSERG